MPLDGGHVNLDIETAEVFEPLLDQDPDLRYYGAEGGRGSGKSHFFADWLVEASMQRHGLSWACIREVQKSLDQSVKKLIQNKIKAHNVGAYFQVQHNRIITPGGGQFSFYGMQNHTADTIKSLEGYDGAWVEEAQTLSQHSLTILRPTIRKPGSKLLFSWNPNKPTDPVDALFKKDKVPGSICVKANYHDNPWFSDEQRRDMEFDKRRDYQRYKHVWLGEYDTNSDGRVFRNWRIGGPEDMAKVKAGMLRRYGGDFGFAVDPTVLVECVLDGRTLYILNEAYQVGCEIDDTPALWDQIPGARGSIITADSARPETISYLRRHGYPGIRPSIKGPGSLVEGVSFLKSLEIVVAPHCLYCIDELANYSYMRDPLTEQVTPHLEDKKNHVIDSIRYSIEDVRRAQGGVW